MWLLFVLPALLACVVADNEEPECPRDDDIYPCFCETRRDDTFIMCENIRNVTLLDDVLKYTRGKNFSFEFDNVRFGDIPSNYFEGQLSVQLTFDNCKITSFGERPFSGLEDTLVDLYIFGSVDQRGDNVTTFPIGHLKKLQLFSASDNNIEVLENDLFSDGPVSVKDVMLTENKIRRLGDKAFASLVNVEELWLSYNKLVNVSRSMFPQPAKKLRIIDFDSNRIASLPDGFFDDMPALDAVYFTENKLKTISEEAWGKAWDHLGTVDLGYNRIVCDEKLKWIYQREKLPESFVGTCRGGKNNLKYLDELTLEDFE